MRREQRNVESKNDHTTYLKQNESSQYNADNPRRACAARVTVVALCVCVFVCPGRSSATHATKRQTRHTHGLSILLAPE